MRWTWGDGRCTPQVTQLLKGPEEAALNGAGPDWNMAWSSNACGEQSFMDRAVRRFIELDCRIRRRTDFGWHQSRENPAN